MQIRRKVKTNEGVMVQYIYGQQNPYIGYCLIPASTEIHARQLLNMADDKFIEKLEQELGEKMIVDLAKNYS